MFNSTSTTNSSVNLDDKAMSNADNNPKQQFQRNLDGFSTEQLYGFHVRKGPNGDNCDPVGVMVDINLRTA